MSCTSDEDVDDCGQGPSATEEEAPTEKSRNEDHCGDDTFTSRITSEKQLEVLEDNYFVLSFCDFVIRFLSLLTFL